MDAEQQNFDELKRLLALKRHEQPTPNFFNHLSDDIRDRLKHPLPEEQLTWWQRLRADFDLKACGVGVLVCGSMLCAMLAAMRWPPPPVPLEDKLTNSLPPQPILSPTQIPDSTQPIIAPGHTNVPTLPGGYGQMR